MIICKLPLTQGICSDLGNGLPTYLEKIFWMNIKWPSSIDLYKAFPIYITSVFEPDVMCADIQPEKGHCLFSAPHLTFSVFACDCVCTEIWKYMYDHKISTLCLVFLSAWVRILSSSNYQRKSFDANNRWRKQIPPKWSL